MQLTQFAPLRVYSHTLWGFSLLLRHNQVFPFIRGYEFTFEGDFDTNITTLQRMLPNKTIDGTITPATLDDLKKTVNTACRVRMLNDGTKVEAPNDDLIWSREKIFWTNLDRYQTFPADAYYMHTPANGSFFADTTLWSFCFIMTKKITADVSHGILVYGKTWENPAACQPESTYEATWRAHNFMN